MKQQLNTRQECLLYFEKLRWGKKVVCPYCFSERTHRAKSEPGRHVCYSCVKSFSVLVNTIFEDTRLSLPIWIAIIKEMLKSKSIIPATAISEKFGITTKTAWLTTMKIRCAMIDDETSLHGLFSIDKHSIRQKKSSRKLDKYFPADNGKKQAVQQLSGSHQSKDDSEVTFVNLTGLLKHYSRQDKNNPSSTVRSFEAMDKQMEQISQNHAKQYRVGKNRRSHNDGWHFIKNKICSENKALSAKYLPFYLLEIEYKFKQKDIKNLFIPFMKYVFSQSSKSITMNNATSKKRVACA